ncbi:unnamed protein product [Brassica rapa]|uniref:VTT domain-containing protein n=1 Tax=Brassica campestris TaxID=3711 RepID=A0A8D9DPV8_BRACM|nr:unnamed protein product [Brassica rapa]
MSLSMSSSSAASAAAAAASTPKSSSSPAAASSTTSWFSGIVRGRGDKPNTAKLSKSASATGIGSGDYGGPIKGKNQFRGVLFKYGPKSIQVAFKTGEYKQQVIFIGGLTDGLLATDYLEPLAIALDKEKWSLVQLLMSSSYSGFGTSSLKQDAQEIDQLISYLINKENSEGVVLLGHSTGCQDIVYYMGTNAACSRAVRAAILQAPVSDREYKATLPETPAMIDLAAKMIKEGRAEELMPREADPCAPISAYRYHSLCAYMGDDDMFSSDLSDDQLKTRLGHMANTACQVIFSMGDEYVPDYVDKKALVNRLSKAMGGAEKVEVEHGNHSLSNRVHEAVQAIMILLILVAAIVLAFYFLPVEQLLRDFLLWVEQDLGSWGPLALAVAYIPLTVLAVPASVLTIGGGYLFGLPIGFVADSVGATLGSGAAFLLGRTIGKPFVVAKLKDYPQFQSVALAIEKSGFKICLLLRLAPLLPFSMLNYLLSVTPITLGPYLLSSWLGMMPITLALVYVGTTLKDLSDVTHKWSELSFGHWASLILSLVVSVILMVCVTKVAQNALRKALAEHGGDMNGAVAASPELNDVADVPADLNEPLLIKIDSQSHQEHENQRAMKEAAG